MAQADRRMSQIEALIAVRAAIRKIKDEMAPLSERESIILEVADATLRIYASASGAMGIFGMVEVGDNVLLEKAYAQHGGDDPEADVGGTRSSVHV